MLYSIFNNCNSLRAVATGMPGSEQKLRHIGMRFHPRRSTISDANNRGPANVFGEIYYVPAELSNFPNARTSSVVFRETRNPRRSIILVALRKAREDGKQGGDIL
jgi:hypothetical protein